MSSDTPVVRCWNCNLNQFEAVHCRRCHRPLDKTTIEAVVEPTEKAPQRSWRSVKYHESMAARVGRRLKAARLAKGLSQRQLAEILDKPRTYLSKIENGSLLPQYRQLMVLSAALGVIVLDLIESNREIDTRLIFTNPFMLEVLKVGGKLPPFYWKKIADHAERLSNGKRIAVSS